MNMLQDSIEFAQNLDYKDPLKKFRDLFYIPKEKVYFNGNSLGLQPKKSQEFVNYELDMWREKACHAQNEGRYPWISYHELVTESLSKLLGANSDEVVAMNSLTTNLHLLMISFYRPTNARYKILIEKGSFPSDRYAVVSQLKFHGFNEDSLIEVSPRKGEHTIRNNDFIAQIEKHGEKIALILLGGVQYYTGQLFDMESIIKTGHKVGSVVGLDLAHAVGNVPLKLHDWQADFAVWCSYKYLNSGPGSIGGAFVHRKHITNKNLPKLTGWWGSDKKTRFEMNADFLPIPTVESWQLSNPPVLQLACLRSSLSLFDNTNIKDLREKSLKLTGYLYSLLSENNALSSYFTIITPSNSAERGCQISLKFNSNSRRIFEFLTEKGVSCDYRYPSVIRVAPVPMYNSFQDIFRFFEFLKEGVTQ